MQSPVTRISSAGDGRQKHRRVSECNFQPRILNKWETSEETRRAKPKIRQLFIRKAQAAPTPSGSVSGCGAWSWRPDFACNRRQSCRASLLGWRHLSFTAFSSWTSLSSRHRQRWGYDRHDGVVQLHNHADGRGDSGHRQQIGLHRTERQVLDHRRSF